MEFKTSSPEILRQIAKFSVDADEWTNARRETGKVDLLGATYLLHEFKDHRERAIKERELDEGFAAWHLKYPELPESSHKGMPNIGPAIYSDEKSRLFIESLDNDSLIRVSERLRARQLDDHIARMLSSKGCAELEDFSIALLENLAIDNDNILNIVDESIPPSADGNSASQFWTFGPFIYKEFKEAGFSNEDSLKAVFEWSKARKETYKPGRLDSEYPGLENPFDDDFYLSNKPDSTSYKLAQKVGKHIADEMLKIIK